MDAILTALLQQGPFGIVAALCLWALWRKDKQVETLYRRLEGKSDSMLAKYYLLGTEMNETIKALMKAMEDGDEKPS